MTGEIPILGVDFSGAKADKNTWVTQGVLGDGVLTITSCQPLPRAGLADLLASLPGTAVAALDFPFSVPKSFAGWWRPEAETMPELWEAAVAMDLEGFWSIRDQFVAEHGEPLRRGDLYFPECYSCLHKTNPNMVPMTFRGMQMLDGLWRSGCRVPPLPGHDRAGPLLLESMPGAALRALGLPYKGYKKGQLSFKLRRRILDGLETRGLPYLVGVASSARFRLAQDVEEDPGEQPAPPYQGQGRPRRARRLEDRIPSREANALLEELLQDAWQAITWREGSKGNLTKEFTRVRV